MPAYPNDLPVVPGLALILCEPPVRGTRRPVGTTCRAFLRDPTLCQLGVRKMCKITCRAPLLPVVTSAKASVDRSRSSGMDVSESEPCIGRAFRKSQISTRALQFLVDLPDLDAPREELIRTLCML